MKFINGLKKTVKQTSLKFQQLINYKHMKKIFYILLVLSISCSTSDDKQNTEKQDSIKSDTIEKKIIQKTVVSSFAIAIETLEAGEQLVDSLKYYIGDQVETYETVEVVRYSDDIIALFFRSIELRENVGDEDPNYFLTVATYDQNGKNLASVSFDENMEDETNYWAFNDVFSDNTICRTFVDLESNYFHTVGCIYYKITKKGDIIEMLDYEGILVEFPDQEAIISDIRKKFKRINESENLQTRNVNMDGEAAEGAWVVSFYDKDELVMMEATYGGESGSSITQMYIHDGNFFFSYVVDKYYNEHIMSENFDTEKSEIVEKRYYYDPSMALIRFIEDKKKVEEYEQLMGLEEENLSEYYKLRIVSNYRYVSEY